MSEPADLSTPANFARGGETKKAPAKQAPAPAPAPASAGDKESAEVGALRAKVAQLEEQRAREKRTSDPRGGDSYSAELALEELWPGQVRESA